ncbi:MAG: UDP-N-acetylmuramoyl-tripeptide--D-alanyl-D-alanine ligase [Clostridiales bacterium]|nr:UDP-N-acetylmuramoyl-tripeptide--D-alanyl-D-alanine ligase [Candidatus Equinaster intestinalis]
MAFNSDLFIITCVILAIVPIFSLYRQFQMFQQNSYYPSRYGKWLYGNFFNRLLILVVVFCMMTVLCKFGKTGLLIELIVVSIYLLTQIYFAVTAAVKSIKKLVFTSRMYRLYASALILDAAAVVLAISTNGALQGMFYSVLALFSAFAPILVFAAWAITYPIEKIIAGYYIKNAKDILASSRNLTVIGVTGSFGKTSTKFILSRILSEKFNVVATPKSYNTPMGIVKTVRSALRSQTEIFVCEMGAKNVGEIKEICDIVKPTIGVITAVGPQHLDTFKSVDNVFKTKFELYDECIKRGGQVFVNADSEELNARLGDRIVTTYGIKNSSNYAKDISYGKEGSRFTIVLGDTEIPVTTRLLGRHAVLNIVGAAAVAYSLGVSAEEIAFAVSRLEPTEHRLEIKQSVCGSYMIDDAYNANPEGCIEAVNVLSYFKDMKKVIVTPGLVELGEKEYDFNYKLGLAATKVCDEIILVGHNRAKPMADAIATTDFNGEKVHIVSSFKEALSVISSFADENTVFLVENDLPDNYLN